MANLKATTAPSFTAAAAAAQPNECVRKGEHDADLAGKAAASHSHGVGDVTGLDAQIQAVVGAALLNTDSVGLVYDGSGKRVSANVRLKAGGALSSDAAGLFVELDSGPGSAASAGHTHADLHAAATVLSSASIALALTGQEISAAVILAESGGLKVVDSGVAVDFGSGAAQAAPGDHTHAGLHTAATVLSSASIALALTGQQVTGSVKLSSNPVGGGKLAVDGAGLFVVLDSGAGSAASAGHTHPLATQAADGLMSSVDKQKLDNYQELFQADAPVLFYRWDEVDVGEYVGGRYQWGQDMEVVRANVTASAPVGAAVLVELEVAGVGTGAYLTIPAGAANAEVVNAAAFSDLFIESGAYARWVVSSGTDEVENSASQIQLAMNVRAAAGMVPEKRINAGGGAVAPFAVDAYYNYGSPASTATAIDLTGATDPAPEAVYQTARTKIYDPTWLTYLITGLGRGVSYTVRLHFAEFYWATAGEQQFGITVSGLTSQSVTGHDTMALAGAKYKAVIREFVLQASLGGTVTVSLKPEASPIVSDYHCSINAIEIIRTV